MFICERLSLLNAVEAVLPLAPDDARGTVTVEEPDRLTVTVGQVDRGARSTALGRVLLPGSVALPLGPLARALRCAIGNCRVELASNGTFAALAIDPDGTTARKFMFEVGADDAPEPPVAGSPAALPGTAFARLVEQTRFLASAQAPFARGWAHTVLQFGIEPGRVTCAATDGLRLTIATHNLPSTRQEAPRALLVPFDVARVWARAARQSETVKLTLTENTALFETGAVTMWADPCAGLFPQWREAMPALPHTITVPTERFRLEVEAALAVADPDEPRVVLATKAGALTLTAITGKARSTMTVPVPGFKGATVQVPLDGRGLLEVVQTYRESSALTLSYGTDREPVLVSAEGDCRCLIAPMIDRTEDAPKTARPVRVRA